MKFFRNKKEAAECCYLRYGRKGSYLDAPVTIEFICLCPDVMKDYIQAQFSSLDVCCVCKYYSSEQDYNTLNLKTVKVL